MLRGFILMLTLLVSTVSYAAQRKLPSDMDAAVLKQVELPYLKVSRGGFSWTRLLTLGIADGNSAKLQITRFTKIHDENDRFIPMGRLAGKTGKTIAFKHNDTNALVREGSWNIELQKTGYIREAGRSMVVKANVQNQPITIVLLNSPTSTTRVNDARKIESWMLQRRS